MLKQVAWHVMSIGDVLALLLIAGVVLQAAGRGVFGSVAIRASAVGFALLLFLPLGSWAIAPLESRFPTPDLPAEIDGIVVLTGAINVHETLRYDQPIFYPYAERITTALRLARRFPAARLVITGGSNRAGEPSEASVHRDLLVRLGVASSRIETEDQSHNTCESANFSYRQIHPTEGERWVLVTSAFHLPRAVACFRHVGWNVIPYPAGYKAQGAPGFGMLDNILTLRLALHEWVGLVDYYLTGRIDDLFPTPKASTDTVAANQELPDFDGVGARSARGGRLAKLGAFGS